MEYLPSYTDSLYLAHHGIKGQKWGVRRFQNSDGTLTPAGHQRYLNKLDYERRSAAAGLYNASRIRDKYIQKEAIQRNKGNVKKADKYHNRAKNAHELAKKEYDSYKHLGKKYEDALNALNKSGYSWKATPVDYMPVKTTKAGKEFVKQNGRFSLPADANVASGNKFKVRETVSDRTASRWKHKHDVQDNKPQRLEVYYS